MAGGTREGSGRKAVRGERKESLSVGVTPTLREYLAEQVTAEPPVSMSETLEDAIRKTKKFREWLKARG